MKRRAVLCYFPQHLHRGAWREPGSPQDVWLDLELHKRLARTAERGKFHAIFIADTAGLTYGPQDLELLSRSSWLLRFEPAVLATALALETSRIGIAMTANTTYNHPYNVARTLAALDHVSGGRAGWNVVMGHLPHEARNYGYDGPIDHALRYRKGEEFYEVVLGLWDSWEDDAFLYDKESGRYFDPGKLHVLDHEGEFFTCAGPLNVTRPPQGYPVIAQAGSSKDGRAFAARVAELTYTLQDDLGKARAFYAEMKAAASDCGRNPDHLIILPGLHLVVAKTDAEAQEKVEQLDALVDPVVGLDVLGQFVDFDVRSLPLDGPVPDAPALTAGAQTKQQFVLDLAHEHDMSVRQLMQWAARFGALGGSPETIADRIEEWVTTGAADGFNIFFANPAESLPAFVDLVIPELQRRGVFRTEYQGTTLRENLGLPRPENRYRTRGRAGVA